MAEIGFAALVLRANSVHQGAYTYRGIVGQGEKRKIEYTCANPEHGVSLQLVHNHLRGQGCQACGREKKVRNTINTFDAFVLKARAVHGDLYEYVATRGAGKGKVVEAVCKVHGVFIQETKSHLSGHGCRKCMYENRTRASLEDFTKAATAVHGGKYEYTGISEPDPTTRRRIITAVCTKHGEFTQRSCTHLEGRGCPICGKVESTESLEVFNYLVSLGVKVEKEKTLSSGKRLDFYLPTLGLGVEYHGVYWHSSKFKHPTYHYDKHMEAEADGIRVIHIFSDEWESKSEIVKRLLARAVGKGEARVFARKTKVVEVNRQVAREFLNSHHIQGSGTAARYVGLSANERLVAVLGYDICGYGRLKVEQGQAVIQRYASAEQVVGGFSKLLSFIKEQHDLKSAKTFSDIRMFSGSMYATCGFKPEYTIPPDYYYTSQNKNARWHKASFQKSRFKSSPKLKYEEGKSEIDLARMNGLYRIYDCGKVCWTLRFSR